MNGYGGRSTNLISSFGNVLLIRLVGPEFSAETVKYLMNVFVRSPEFLINSSHELIYAGLGWQWRNRA